MSKKPAKVDIYFLADATGSMATAIDNVKADMVAVYHRAAAKETYDIQTCVL